MDFRCNDDKQAEKLKSCKEKEGWMNSDEGWMMNYDDLKLLRGFDLWQMDKRTDICDCRVAFATENYPFSKFQNS